MVNAKKAANSAVPISSVDNDKVILADIADGSVVGSACYSGAASATWCMSDIVNILNGVKDIPAAIFYQNQKVTKDNVAEMFAHYYPGTTLEEYQNGQG